MESIRNVKEALTERSRVASLDELRNRGRKQVKVIRAEHIASMIEESVQRAIQESGLIPKDEADALTERSREEFASLVAERQREAQDVQALREELGRAKAELTDAQHALSSTETERDTAEAARDAAEQARVDAESALESVETERESVDAAEARHEQELGSVREELSSEQSRAEELASSLAAAQAEIESLQRELESAQQSLETASQTPAAVDPSNPLLIQMAQEIERLKTEAGNAPAPAQAAAPQGAAPDLAAQMASALEGLTRSMDERLEKMGKKMGISSAVDAGSVNLEGLFREVDDAQVESNLDDMEVKKTKGGGIGANLARLRQLKGPAASDDSQQ